MGIIRPPWVSKKWFDEAPFNYCDHFGDKEELSLMCKICRNEIAWRKKLIREGRNPDSLHEAFQEVEKNFAVALEMIKKFAKESGINLNNLDNEENLKDIQTGRYKIYRIARKYGDKVEKIIKSLEFVPADTNIYLLRKAIDVLSHSRFYVIVKIHRALSGRREEKKDEFLKEITDSKTSAHFAYIAIDRNSRALFRLSRHKPLVHFKKSLLKMAKISDDFKVLIKEEFFPGDEIEDKEFGADSYNTIFT